MRYWGGLSMNIPVFLLRGKLAEARLQKPEAARFQTVAGTAGSDWQPGEHADSMLVAVGACIGRAQLEASLALLHTAPGSKAEIADTDAMLPEAGRRCVPSGQILRVPMSNLRAAITLGLYHRLDGATGIAARN